VDPAGTNRYTPGDAGVDSIEIYILAAVAQYSQGDNYWIVACGAGSRIGA